MRCIITSVAELGTPKLLLAVATSFHPGTSTGHGTSLKFSMVADRRANLVGFSGASSSSWRAHYVLLGSPRAGREVDIAHDRRFLPTFLCDVTFYQ